MNLVRRFLSDRLNAAWVVALVAVVLVLVFVPNEGAGTVLLIVVAAAAIVVSSAVRIRDGRRDREKRRARGEERRGPLT